MKITFIDGERLYLRPLEESDLDCCMQWINDSELQTFLGRRHPMGRAQEKEWLAGQYKSEAHFNLAIVLKDGDRHIGNCGFNTIDHANRSAEFGILIGEKDAWHQGFGPEAARLIVQYGFEELGLHRIELEVFSLNPRARKAYEKIGFVLEGTKRESYFRHGTFHDTHIMSILESEWSQA
ncbi:GNAT family N-acetyltransferase [Candidatus Bipolaricaulota bacterium]|nr:GNAT family N-acetyltransferase [Candidatus Bipolaricaulota bacterium]